MINRTSHWALPAKKLGAKFQTQSYQPHQPIWLTNYTFFFLLSSFCISAYMVCMSIVLSPSQIFFWNKAENKQIHKSKEGSELSDNEVIKPGPLPMITEPPDPHTTPAARHCHARNSCCCKVKTNT